MRAAKLVAARFPRRGTRVPYKSSIGGNTMDKPLIPNEVVASELDAQTKGEAPLQPEDIDEKREEMKNFAGGQGAVKPPVPGITRGDTNR